MNLKLERETFLYELNGRGYNFENTDWYEDWEMFEDDHLNMVWEMWLASRNREGYVLAPVEPKWEMIDAGENSCYGDDEDLVKKIYKAMMGAIDE